MNYYDDWFQLCQSGLLQRRVSSSVVCANIFSLNSRCSARPVEMDSRLGQESSPTPKALPSIFDMSVYSAIDKYI